MLATGLVLREVTLLCGHKRRAGRLVPLLCGDERRAGAMKGRVGVCDSDPYFSVA
jgi:hypothetical protein